jgi:hypothetical protein
MAPTEMTVFDLHRRRVEDMVAEGHSFARVEQSIQNASVARDERDALWLFAWALRGRGHARVAQSAASASFAARRPERTAPSM